MKYYTIRVSYKIKIIDVSTLTTKKCALKKYEKYKIEYAGLGRRVDLIITDYDPTWGEIWGFLI